jgi:hypothetical protein
LPTSSVKPSNIEQLPEIGLSEFWWCFCYNIGNKDQLLIILFFATMAQDHAAGIKRLKFLSSSYRTGLG